MTYHHDYTSAPAEYWEKRRRAQADTRERTIVYPEANELFVDIDSYQALEVYHAVKHTLQGLILSETVRPSPSKKADRFHITVKLSRRVTALERIAMQAMLGSDPMREALSYREHLAGVPQPTIFFEALTIAEKMDPTPCGAPPRAPAGGAEHGY